MTNLLDCGWQKDKLHEFDVVGNDGVIEVSFWLQSLHITRSYREGLTLILLFIVDNELSSEKFGNRVSQKVGSFNCLFSIHDFFFLVFLVLFEEIIPSFLSELSLLEVGDLGFNV